MQNVNAGARPWGVTVLGIFLIVTSLMHMGKLMGDYSVYVKYYHYLPPWLMHSRYAFSWAQRVAGLGAGIGLLYRRNIARQTVILIGWITMIFVFWKHPFPAWQKHVHYLDQQPAVRLLFAELGSPHFRIASIAWKALIVYYILEILFWSCSIYYLTRPRVKARFLSP